MQVGKCVFVWALRGRLLDTIHWKSLILEVVPGDPGGEWKLRQWRKAASIQSMLSSKLPQWETGTQSLWEPLGSSIEYRSQYFPTEERESWGIYPPLPTSHWLTALTEAVLSLAFLAWLCRSQCVPQRPEKVSDKWTQMLAFGSWARVWWLRMRREKLGIDSTYNRADPQSDHQLSSLSFHLFLEL